MSRTLFFYDPKAYTILVSGIVIAKGYADGEFITVDREVDAYTTVRGVGGGVTRLRTNNRGALVSLILMQTAEANSYLSALHNRDMNAPNGEGVGSFLLKDAIGTTIYKADKCWIRKPPTLALDKTAKERRWLIEIARLFSFDGSG